MIATGYVALVSETPERTFAQSLEAAEVNLVAVYEAMCAARQ
jgi:hypothetical protein